MSTQASESLFRARDVIAATVGLVLLSPVLGGTYIVVRSKLGPPAIFGQERPGRDGRIFTIYKFRSMLPIDPARGLVTDEERLTVFGRRLRATSLDELPSLVNVLRGDMSLVGPRPLLVEYLDCYTPTQARRHDVRPGLTGLAQVSGRNAISWEARLELDECYVDNRSFWLDARILSRTVLEVLKRAGVAAEGQAAMPRFSGSASAGPEPPGEGAHAATANEAVRPGVST